MTIRACEASVDNFIYVPKKKMFFFADDFDHVDDKVIFYFEQANEKGGFTETTLEFNRDEEIQVVSNYKVTPKMILEEKKNFYQTEIDSMQNFPEQYMDEYKTKERFDLRIEGLNFIIEKINNEIKEVELLDKERELEKKEKQAV